MFELLIEKALSHCISLAKTELLHRACLSETVHSVLKHSLPYLIDHVLPLIIFPFLFSHSQTVLEKAPNLEPPVGTAYQVRASWLSKRFTSESLSQKETQLLLFLELP